MNQNNFVYLGSELHLFTNVPNWKRYLQSEISNVIGFQDVGVEIGSGIGSNAPYFSKLVRNYIGIEPDENLVEKSKLLHPNFFFKVGLVTDLPQLNIPVNVIFYIDVLEHILEDELELVLAAKCLKPNSKIVILVPAYNWLFSDFDLQVGHHRRYSKKDFLSKVPNSLKIIEMKYLDSVGAILSFLAKTFRLKNSVTPNSIRIWHFLLPASKYLDKLFQYKFGKSFLLVLEVKK